MDVVTDKCVFKIDSENMFVDDLIKMLSQKLESGSTELTLGDCRFKCTGYNTSCPKYTPNSAGHVV